MTAADILKLALMLLGAHWLADYPLQGQFLSDAKVKGPLRLYHLVAHAGIQGAGVALVTGNAWLGLSEWIAHTAIDEAKVRGKTSFAMDQALHIGCKVLWLLIVLLLLASCQSQQDRQWQDLQTILEMTQPKTAAQD